MRTQNNELVHFDNFSLSASTTYSGPAHPTDCHESPLVWMDLNLGSFDATIHVQYMASDGTWYDVYNCNQERIENTFTDDFEGWFPFGCQKASARSGMLPVLGKAWRLPGGHGIRIGAWNALSTHRVDRGTIAASSDIEGGDMTDKPTEELLGLSEDLVFDRPRNPDLILRDPETKEEVSRYKTVPASITRLAAAENELRRIAGMARGREVKIEIDGLFMVAESFMPAEEAKRLLENESIEVVMAVFDQYFSAVIKRAAAQNSAVETT